MRRAAFSGISAPDPFVVPDGNDVHPPGGHKYPIGKTLSTPRLAAGENTVVLVVAGQSNCCNSVDALYSPTNTGKIDNFNVYDGGVYAADDPLLGCTITDAANSGNMFGRVADKLIDNAFCERVVLVTIGFGATDIGYWRTGGSLNSRLLIAPQRLAAVGLSVTAFLWMQGEGDTSLGTAQQDYEDALEEVIGTPRAAGYDAPWLIGLSTYTGGTTSTAVRAAQAAAVNDTDIFAGADTDTLTGTTTNRQANDTHFKAAGADAAADLWAAAIAAALA